MTIGHHPFLGIRSAGFNTHEFRSPVAENVIILGDLHCRTYCRSVGPTQVEQEVKSPISSGTRQHFVDPQDVEGVDTDPEEVIKDEARRMEGEVVAVVVKFISAKGRRR